MVSRLLDEGRLEELIEKLKLLPINKWKRKEESEAYEPHPDSSSIGQQTKCIWYKVDLNRFKIVLYQESHHGYATHIFYNLEIFRNQETLDRSRVLDKKTEYHNSGQIKGKIQILYEEVDRKYIKNREIRNKKEQRNILKEFKSIV